MSRVEARNAWTALMIPVPAADAVAVNAWITLLDPFLPLAQVDEGVLDELEEFFAAVTPFAFVIGEPARFPDGPTYLPLEPSAAFRRIIVELSRGFPEVVTAAAGFETNMPHLLVPDSTASEPIRTHASEARLLLRGDTDQVLATFVFGTSAA